MMGHYYYYTTSIIDAPDGHDCMWSGECLYCQSEQEIVVQSIIKQASHGGQAAVPSLGGSGREEANKSPADSASGGAKSPASVGEQQQQEPLQQAPANRSPGHSIGHPSKLSVEYQADFCGKSLSGASEAQQLHQQYQLQPVALPAQQSCKLPSSSTKQSTLTKQHNHHHHQSSSKPTSAKSDNKKLRHREVEKNRHRQLQAMVKTLSERIPGRQEKETQVQTMKRAARYCMYLRDSMSLLAHGQAQLQPEKLEKTYLKAWDNVELIMSQHMSAR